MTAIAKKSVATKSVPSKSVPKKSTPFDNSHYNNPTQKETCDIITKPQTNYLENKGLESFVSFPPCIHLQKVMESSSRDAILKTYSASIKIVA